MDAYDTLRTELRAAQSSLSHIEQANSDNEERLSSVSERYETLMSEATMAREPSRRDPRVPRQRSGQA